VRSRYDEDVHPQNHTSVWGSYWHAGAWGYACCKSTTKNSMCLGAKAEQVAAQNAAAMASNAAAAERDRGAVAEAAAKGAVSLCCHNHMQGSSSQEHQRCVVAWHM
jgi:hypothetical protein